jgi:hypothetical protein
VTVGHWRIYDSDEIAALAASAKGLSDSSERVCPVCGHRSVRRYLYDYAEGSRPVGMSYVWCANCHRYSGSTGLPFAERYEFADPATESRQLRQLRNTDLFGLLDHLDSLWDSGVLPQQVMPR